MELKRKPKLLFVAGGLIFLLGITRGIGGIIYMLSDDKALESLSSGIFLVAILVISLILLSAASFISAIAIFEHDKKYMFIGFIVTIIFIASGTISGILMSDYTSTQEIFINFSAIVIIITFLVIGKRILV